MESTFLLQWADRILIASLEAAAIVAILSALAAACRILLPPRWRCALWSLPFLHLALSLLPSGLMPALPRPFSLAAFLSHVPGLSAFLSLVPGVSAFLPQAALSPAFPPPDRLGTAPEAADGGVFPLDPAAQAQQVAGSDGLSPLLLAAALVWLAGCATIVLRAAAAHIRLRRYVASETIPVPGRLLAMFDDARRRAKVRANATLRLTNAVRTPALYGIFSPTVLVPAYLADRLSAEEWECIFRHELMHHRRRDPAAAAAMFLLAALHWFNPAVWYALRRMRREQEAACDAAVLDQRIPKHIYAACIVRVLELNAAQRQKHRRAPDAGLAFASGRKSVERRIRMIQSHSRQRLAAALLGPLVVAAAAFFTWSLAFAAPSPSDSRTFLMPASGEVATPFGDQVHPKLGTVFHDGIDIANPEPAEVRAAAAGVVTAAEYDPVRGLTVRIDHGGGWVTEYRHLASLALEAGDEVQEGDRLGMMGSTGQSTGQHLHFAIWKHGEPADPLAHIR